MTATKTKINIALAPRTWDVRTFTEPRSSAHANVHEYYNKTDHGHFSYNIQDIWVPLYSRGTGMGSLILQTVLDYYDEQDENLRLVAAGCCAPTRNDDALDIADMHRGDGHYHGCTQVTERLSHHGLQRWYRSFGFVDHPDSGDDLCCTFYLYRPHHG